MPVDRKPHKKTTNYTSRHDSSSSSSDSGIERDESYNSRRTKRSDDSKKSISRSVRLRKYESVYESCMKKLNTEKTLNNVKRSKDNKRVRKRVGRLSDEMNNLSFRMDSSERKKSSASDVANNSDRPPTRRGDGSGSLRRESKDVKVNKEREDPEIIKVEEKKKKVLNEYQKFMRSESKKPKYFGMSGGDRMKAISKEWKARTTTE